MKCLVRRLCSISSQAHHEATLYDSTILLCYNADLTGVVPQLYLNRERIPVVDSDKYLGNYISTNIHKRNIIGSVSDIYQRSNWVISDPSSRQEVQGTADVDGGAYLPFLPLPRTPSRLSSFRSTDGRTGRTERVIERGRCLRPIFRAVCSDGSGVRRWPCTTTSFGPPRELPPARLYVIHRTNLCQRNVGNAEGCIRGQASVLLHPATLAADNGRTPHY